MYEDKPNLSSHEQLVYSLIQAGSDMYGYFVNGRRCILPETLAVRRAQSPVIDNFPQWMIDKGYVHSESASGWLSMFDAIDRGEVSGFIRVTLRVSERESRRFRIFFHSVFDDDKKPLYALVTFVDINTEYEQSLIRESDINGLLQAARMIFPEILTLNLTKNSYRIVQYAGATTVGTPREGKIEDMISLRIRGLVAEDRRLFGNVFSIQNLHRSFVINKEDSISLAYRRLGTDGSKDAYWFETIVMRQENTANDDVLLVAMSRIIDEQKAEEIRLREELRLQQAELRLSMSRLGRVICYYDIRTSTLTMPEDAARKKGVPNRQEGFPELLISAPPPRLLRSSLEIILSFYNDIRSGKPSGECRYPIVSSDGDEKWMKNEYITIFDDDGKPIRAVIAVEDVTISHTQSAENQRLRQNERILQVIAQHSDRLVMQYDVKTKTIYYREDVPEFESFNSHCIDLKADDEYLFHAGGKEFQSIIDRIHQGSASGEEKLSTTDVAGDRHWVDVKYSIIFDENGAPVSAIISTLDITERYEHELAYMRHIQQLESAERPPLIYIESDITEDWVDRVSGQLFPDAENTVGCLHSDFYDRVARDFFVYENEAEASEYFSIDSLLRSYNDGKRSLQSVWKVTFSDGSGHWLNTDISIMADPYTKHIKAFFRMDDVTEEKEAELEMKRRSEHDGMTGLLNRVTAEGLIRERISVKSDAGILILLDLDDLKSINDTFGHEQGDRAIKNIAEMLKSHFRESDIIGRVGGDEFIVFLPRSAQNSGAIALSMGSLLRKLSGLAVGAGDERRLHCSIGCAIQSSPDDSLESLFKQADTALYHVKRSGKNNFAFYSPEMERADYRFQAHNVLSGQLDRKFEISELHYLLEAISILYPLVLTMNLSLNSYYLIDEIPDGVFSELPNSGAMDNFVSIAASIVHPDDRAGFIELFSRKAMLDAYSSGEKNLHHYLRFLVQGGYRWIEITVTFYTNDGGDVCLFALIRFAPERKDP